MIMEYLLMVAYGGDFSGVGMAVALNNILC